MSFSPCVSFGSASLASILDVRRHIAHNSISAGETGDNSILRGLTPARRKDTLQLSTLQLKLKLQRYMPLNR